MNSDIQIQLLGIGAAQISYGNRKIFIDAFNSYNKSPILYENDILLFTHDDQDHFFHEKVLNNINAGNIIIGPPSISFLLLESGKIKSGQMKYPAAS